MKNIVLILLFAVCALAGPVSHFGALKVCKINGTGYLCGEKTGTSTKIQVKGPSLFWHSTGEGNPFYVPEIVDWFVDNMQIAVIRAAMGVRYQDNMTLISNSGTTSLGYYDDPVGSKRVIKSIVDAAIANDIYVIVDWHSPDAHNETELAKQFFKEMATEYKGVPNIIWELYNEPHTPGTNAINTYANAVIKEIRDAGSNNLVLIGSQSYSSKPNEQASAWGTSDNAVTNNVAFTVHFYAATSSHSGYMSNANSAMSSGYAVFASEWGFSAADGGGNVVQGSTFTSWMDNNTISNCNWNASAKNEGSSMFSTGTNMANLSTSRLTTSGNYFYTYMTSGKKWVDFVPSSHPKGKDVTVSVNDGSSITLNSTQLGLTGTVTGVSQPEEGTASYTSNSVTFATSQSGTLSEKVRFKYSITQNNITVEQRITVNITNRHPVLPQKNPITVSRKIQTKLGLTNDFSPRDPSNTALSFKSVSLSNASVGTVTLNANKDSLTFTPAASMQNASLTDVTLHYSVQNAAGLASSASVILRIQNLAPIINTNNICCLSSKPNTSPIGIGVSQVGAYDREGDRIWFVELYLDSKYPGSLTKIKQDSFVYYPENDKTGKVVMLAVVTDGVSNSVVGKTNLTLTGNGQSIGDITPPTEIPNYVPPDPPDPPGPPEPPLIALPTGKALAFGLKTLGSGKIEISFAQSGFAKLDIYSLSGKNLGNVFNEYQNTGSREVSLKNLNLQKGVYILRLSQGSQVKTLRIVN